MTKDGSEGGRGSELIVKLRSPVAGAQIFYTLDGTAPSRGSSRYESAFVATPSRGTAKLDLRTIIVTESGRTSGTFSIK
jgi:hexosaminidase